MNCTHGLTECGGLLDDCKKAYEYLKKDAEKKAKKEKLEST